MGWVSFSGGTFRYAGRISRAPFAAWASGPRGRPLVESLAATRGFSLFGRERAVRRDLWRELEEAARSEPVAHAIREEVAAYLRHLADLAYAESLPRAAVNLRRLVAVPRVLANAGALPRSAERLEQQPALAALAGGPALRAFFTLQLIDEIDGAILAARPAPGRLLPVRHEWAVAGAERDLVWQVPLEPGPEWHGHFFLYEAPRQGPSRAERRQLAARMAEIDAAARGLSRLERTEVLRQAR